MRNVLESELSTVSGGWGTQDDGFDDSVGFIVAQFVSGSIVLSVEAINNGSLSGFADWDGNGAYTQGDDPVNAASSYLYSAEEIAGHGFDTDNNGVISESEGDAFANYLQGILTVPFS